MESSREYQRPKFKDIQKLIANKLEHPKALREARTIKAPPRATACLTPKDADTQTSAPLVYSPPSPPPLPPPPPPPRFPAKAATTPKVHPLVVASLTRQEKKRDPPAVATTWNQKKPTVISVHDSIVGEIQNRSAHLLAADERPVLRHFKWPERKTDAMREAAIEYRDLKLLETEISSYKDDTSIPCEVALKRMAGLLDKSERSIQRVTKLRNSVMHSYQECKIPVDWMLDSGMVNKIKQASMKLVTMYLKRVGTELQLVRSLHKESAQEALLLQGMHFANRAHQFTGHLDSETLCALKEIKQCIPRHLLGSKELLAGISISPSHMASA